MINILINWTNQGRSSHLLSSNWYMTRWYMTPDTIIRHFKDTKNEDERTTSIHRQLSLLGDDWVCLLMWFELNTCVWLTIARCISGPCARARVSTKCQLVSWHLCLTMSQWRATVLRCIIPTHTNTLTDFTTVGPVENGDKKVHQCRMLHSSTETTIVDEVYSFF